MVDFSPILALPAPLAVGISPLAANGLAFAFTGAYVGSLYIARHFFGVRPTEGEPQEYPPPGHRDHPGTMKLRMKAVGLATRMCLSAVLLLVKKIGGYPVKQAWLPAARLLGFSSTAYQKPLAYLLTPILFLGPLYGYFLDEALPGQKNFSLQFGLPEQRNYVIGPLTEELVFRSAIISVSLLGGLSWKQIVFTTPLWFGLAHVHHAYQTYRDQGSTARAAKMAAMGATLQLGYTTLFGWIAAYLYIRTGSVLPSIISHTFCNMMGLPMIGHSLQDHPNRRIPIWLAYIAGIAGFAYFLPKL